MGCVFVRLGCPHCHTTAAQPSEFFEVFPPYAEAQWKHRRRHIARKRRSQSTVLRFGKATSSIQLTQRHLSHPCPYRTPKAPNWSDRQGSIGSGVPLTHG